VGSGAGLEEEGAWGALVRGLMGIWTLLEFIIRTVE
jgi:hypothetical protein